MKFEEVLPAYRAGKKIRRHGWLITLSQKAHYTEVTTLLHNAVMAEDWEVIEEPKPPKLMAPAFFKCGTGVYVSGILFSSTEDAIDRVIGDLIAWPAIPDANGFYSVPQE